MGVGGVGLVLGTIFGIRALSIGDQSDLCKLGPQGNGCPTTAVDDQNTARSSGTISTIGFVAGGVLAAGGAVLFFTAPKPGQGSRRTFVSTRRPRRPWPFFVGLGRLLMRTSHVAVLVAVGAALIMACNALLGLDELSPYEGTTEAGTGSSGDPGGLQRQRRQRPRRRRHPRRRGRQRWRHGR